ncbi:MAG: hypothetical protein HXS46_09585 [Theionarchaea archaeon]|nr:MAG: hypothetical protein AYK18_08965 [Theionarchaea archaeon DG-70]MBU7010930.1 hypothetical protein [Theionarchaea archaeon]
MEQEEKETDDGTLLLTAGGGLTAVAVAGIAAGVTCPVCVVGAPLLFGYGLYKRHKSKKL